MPGPAKCKIVNALIKHYGNNWKTPLTKDLGVNRSTIRRIFNQREDIPIVYKRAFDNIVNGEEG